MLAELFMLRLEALSRMNARTTEAGDNARFVARFVPFKPCANLAKPVPARIGEMRAGE